ncbi:MAG: ATP-dependent DNA helicase RecG [Ruminococcaceae bacterium]|nr:ATP-dependent DNA helicase RecG [Oscillospiraceae bacterium]
MPTVTEKSPVTVLPGVGRVRAECYARLGITTLGELLSHYPRAYENRGEIRLLRDARADAKTAVILTVATEPRCVRLRSRKSFLKFRAFDESASCEIVYFNQDYLRDKFTVGSEFRFWGRVERVGRNGLSMSSPIAEPYAPGVPLKRLCAVWRLTDGLSQKQVERDVTAALELLAGGSEDPLPAALLRRRNLCTLAFAERNIHLPADPRDLTIARRRLVYQEFFDFSLGATMLRSRAATHTAPPCAEGSVNRLLRQLPYSLTGAQARAVEEIRRDLARSVPMARMVVGDVGCGKTVVAAAAMLIAVQSGRQAALMAPTEILARQHYKELSDYFTRLGISCALLIGASTAKEKREIKAALSAEDPQKRLQVVIGTHALLSDGVEFAAPGLVVTDEQHRFGAGQRALLSQKNGYAHLLVMSATPIPRSLALVLYGDIELSRIDEMPPGRQRVDTFVVDESYRDRLNGFIEKQVEEGGQVYVVCPSVEEQEVAEDEVALRELDSNGLAHTEEKPTLKAAVAYAAELAERFPRYGVAFLHGRLKSKEKDEVMRRFADGEVQILVSTTVIEVGVNVPNACLMIVENAERFGLSQLHQLRGRVGRGKRKSYCVLVAGGEGKLSESARGRLQVMRTTYDGYAIAEQDLAQRGPGDFLGNGEAVRQSGALCFRIANAAEDTGILTQAAEDARALLREDPSLQSYPLLAERARAMFTQRDGLIS